MTSRPIGLATLVIVALMSGGFQTASPRIDLSPQLVALAEDADEAREFDYMDLKDAGLDLNALSNAVHRRAIVTSSDPRCLTEGEAVLQENLAAANAATDRAAFDDTRAEAADAWSKFALFEEGLAHGQVATEQPFKTVSDAYAAAEAETDPRARDLLRRTARDQAHRHAYSAGDQVWGDLSPAASVRVMARLSNAICHVDRDNTAWLKADVAANGWFRISTNGARASNAAWLMAQHADRDRAFQRHVLALMEPLVEAGEVTRANYAYLWDRLAVSEDRPQRYGTQGRCVGRDRWEPNTLEDPDRVETLRERADIGPLTEYQARMHRYCADFEG